MAKLKNRNGFRYVKELGGAVRRSTISFAAGWLADHGNIKGRVLDFGCGFGLDASHFGWDAYDPYYRQEAVQGPYDTVICDHVLNMLTRQSRANAIENVRSLLADDGAAFLIAPRNISMRGKVAMRKRIQNYVVLSLPSIYADAKLEIYRLEKRMMVSDTTDEIEDWLAKR